MQMLVDGLKQPIGLGDTFIHKGKRGWSFGIVKGISLRYGRYILHVYIARQYYSADKYYYTNSHVSSSNHIYKTNGIPDNVRAALLRKVMPL